MNWNGNSYLLSDPRIRNNLAEQGTEILRSVINQKFGFWAPVGKLMDALTALDRSTFTVTCVNVEFLTSKNK